VPSHLNRRSEQPPASGGSEKGLLQTPGARPALMGSPTSRLSGRHDLADFVSPPESADCPQDALPCAQRRSPSKRRGQSSSFATNAERPDLPELDSETKGTEAYCPRATGSSAPKFLPSTEFVDVGCRPGARGRHGRALPPEVAHAVRHLLAPSARPLRGRVRGFRWNRGGCSSPLTPRGAGSFCLDLFLGREAGAMGLYKSRGAGRRRARSVRAADWRARPAPLGATRLLTALRPRG